MKAPIAQKTRHAQIDPAQKLVGRDNLFVTEMLILGYNAQRPADPVENKGPAPGERGPERIRLEGKPCGTWAGRGIAAAARVTRARDKLGDISYGGVTSR